MCSLRLEDSLITPDEVDGVQDDGDSEMAMHGEDIEQRIDWWTERGHIGHW